MIYIIENHTKVEFSNFVFIVSIIKHVVHLKVTLKSLLLKYFVYSPSVPYRIGSLLFHITFKFMGKVKYINM